MNNILILINEKSEKKYYSFPPGVSESKALKLCSSHEDGFVSSSHLFINNAQYPLSYYENDGKELGAIDSKKVFIKTHSFKVREYRSSFLSSLDLPFVRSLESDDSSMKDHIIKLKTFLRDLPQNLKYSNIEKEEDLLRYNPFNIVTQIILTNTGSGYLRPPAIKIEPPNGIYFGFAPKAVCFIKDGQVVKIEVTEFGCGYVIPPVVEIESPKDKDGNSISEFAAKAFCSPVELAIGSY